MCLLKKGFPGFRKFDHAHMQQNLCTGMFMRKLFVIAPIGLSGVAQGPKVNRDIFTWQDIPRA